MVDKISLTHSVTLQFGSKRCLRIQRCWPCWTCWACWVDNIDNVENVNNVDNIDNVDNAGNVDPVDRIGNVDNVDITVLSHCSDNRKQYKKIIKSSLNLKNVNQWLTHSPIRIQEMLVHPKRQRHTYILKNWNWLTKWIVGNILKCVVPKEKGKDLT